jgi:C-terminal processing protease CtpA/Prc
VLDELMKLENSSYGTYDTVYYGNIKPHGFVFSGKLYILMNGLSVSTTGLVCNSLRLHRGALFIGEPGGFTPQGTFGQAIRFTLPNSGIAGYMSTIRFNSTNDFIIDSIPFMPDIHVNETIEDILEGRDPVLEKTLEIIRRKQE